MELTPIVTAYDVAGAAGEILMMLFVAFTLGAAFGYLIREPAGRRPRRHATPGEHLQLPAAPGSMNRDKLQSVPGIGPQLEELLNAEGIFTYRQLADTSPARLHAIMEKAGRRFYKVDPTNWPSDAQRLHTAI